MAIQPGVQMYRDFECRNCGSILRGSDNDPQVEHKSDCQTLIEYSEILKEDPEAFMQEDLAPLGKPYTLVDGERQEIDV